MGLFGVIAPIEKDITDSTQMRTCAFKEAPLSLFHIFPHKPGPAIPHRS